jgi:hypothetical protein
MKHEPVAECNGGGVWSVATWVACSCGWNETGDAKGTWLEHQAETQALEAKESK